MSKKIYGIYKSSSSILIDEIDEAIDYKKFSNVVEIEHGHSYNGNGNYYMKIFTQGEFKEIASGKWKINPLINCGYNWTCEWGNVDVIDVNNKECQCHITIDYRTIYKRNGDNTEGIKNIFRFIASLKEDYLNVEHYLLHNKIDRTLNDWEHYDDDDVVLSLDEYSGITNKLLEINREFEQFQSGISNLNDLAVVNNLKDTLLIRLREKYDSICNSKK